MTSRTSSPSQDPLGTARLPDSSPAKEVVEELLAVRDNRDAELYDGGYVRTLSAQAAALLTRLSADRDRLEREREQAYTAGLETGRMEAAIEQARAERAEAEARRSRYAELAWEKHCKEAEAERDSERERASSLGRRYEAECARAINAEAERDALKAELESARDERDEALAWEGTAKDALSSLKARAAEVLEPWAAIYRVGPMGGQRLPIGEVICRDGMRRAVEVRDLRRAAELHADLAGERS